MCDEHTVNDNKQHLQTGITRRRFNHLAVAAALVAIFSSEASVQTVIETEVVIPTLNGEADCYFVHPTSGSHAGVVIWPDILGLRSTFRALGRRLAEAGYSVLVVNPFYRSAPAPVVPEGASFQDPDVRSVVMALREELTVDAQRVDARAFVAYLDAHPAVDTRRRVGVMGYCMGGPIVMRAAAELPERIGAVASFHGGGLATAEEDSPHLLIPTMAADFLIAVAENDHERAPAVNDILRNAFVESNLKAEVEVYEGALHGWCVPDSPVYDKVQAERAWGRLLMLFEKALA
ncbi:MAG: dienelactone hydrolase family protein [Porticoccaceae bacterium]|nr:dienelactone hydrolase family protein [Porticoccaceae bacterium]